MESLQQEIFIPVKINKRKMGTKTYFVTPNDCYVVTPLSKLLAKAYVMEKHLREDQEHSFNEFCKLHNITPKYLSRVLQLNNLSPKLKRMIIAGYQPKHLSVPNILRAKIPLLWKEQEKWFCG